MSKIPAINEIDANSPSQESTEVVVKAATVTPDINEIKETISASATIQEIDGTRKPTISEIYKIVNDGLFESTTNWWDYAYKLSQAQLNQDIISRLDNGVIGGGYSKGVEIITTTSNKVPSNTNVYSALKSDSLYPKKLNDEVINGIYDFLNGLTIGKPTAYTGGTWSVDQTGKTHLTTDYLYVRLKAIFETLQILNVDTIGGKLVISPAGSIRVAYVDRIKINAPVFKHDENTDIWSISQVEDAEGNFVNETLNQEVYRCYFLGEQDGEEIDNKWKVGDQAQAKTFNVKKGTYHKVENSYLWRLVVNVSSDTVDIDGKKYHYVDLSQIDFDSGSDAPAPGDVLNQLGHRLNDTQRQTALVLNAVDNYAPSITLYAGVNYYTLLNKEYVEFGVYNGKAFFNVYGDMYIGDKGTNPKTYIKYKNGKINIKANLEIGSSIGDKDLDQYIKENAGVDENKVLDIINNSQVIKDLQKQTDGAIETWFYEGVPTLDNLPAVDWTTGDLKKKHIGDLYYDQTTGYAYRFTKYNDDVNPYRWNRIKDNDIVAALDAASRAQITADGKMKVFYGETKPTNYQVGDMWVNATLEGKFNNDIARAVADNKTSFNANDWVLASRYSEAIATIQKWTNEYETKFSNLVDEVKQQKDQSIVVWYYGYEPTVDNAPANTWNTDELRSEHIGDIFYDIKNNHSYRWTGTTWIQIKDADFDEAMKAAKVADDKAGAAGDLADSKRRIFYSDTTPTEPFDKGDLWIKQVGDKTETWVYNGTDWVKSDDKALNDFKNTINDELTGIKGQLDGKAETWYQVDDPSTDWTDKVSHEGDIWYNTNDGTTNYWNGSAWEQMDIPKDVFDTIDGKSSIFVDSYADAKAGTGVISKGYKERDLWILPEDATVNGVKYYKGDMLTAVSKNTNFDETNWKKKVRYVGPTELNNAIDVVNEKINTINNITIPGINNKFNEFIEDGVLDSSEKARLTDLLNQASNEVAAVIDQVNNIITSKYLTNDNANKGKLEEANNVMKTAWTEYKNLINTLIDANTEITKVNIGEANTKYNNLQEKIKTVKQYLAICQADILSGIGTDISSYKYLKEAFKGKTEVNGGLVVTNVLQLRQTSNASSPVTAGISGLQGKANANGVVDTDTYDITSIAAWFGGPMVDKDIFTDEELNNKVAGTDYARSLFRHDGSGYLASGSIYWGTDGVLHGDPNSFILQGTSIATMFYYVRLFYLHNPQQGSTDFNKIAYVTPMKTFSRLSVLSLGGIEAGNSLPTGLFIGDSNTGGSFQIGNIILRTKSGDPNILEIVSASSNKTAHLGVQGGISAYGTYTPSTGGGGGLNGTIVPYSTAITSDPQNEGSKIASASSIYKLHSRISAIENNGATSITVTGTGNAITSVVKNGTSITFTKGTTFLTSHQSLANYVTIDDVRLSDSRYPKFDNNTWYLVGDNAYIGDHNNGGIFCIKSANSDNVSGIALYNSSENAAARLWFDNTNVNLDKQLVMNNKRIWIQGVGTAGGNNNRLTIVSGMPSGLAFNTSCRGTILYSNGIAFADPYNSNSNSDSGWIRHLETSANNGTLEIAVGGDNDNEQIHFRWYNYASALEHISHDITVPRATGTLALTSQIPTTLPANGGNADTVDGVHANGLLTALSNSNNGISITVGGTIKSISNISVNHASNADTATTSSMLKTANWNGSRYVPSDTHYMCLGYMNCTGSYDCLTLLVTSAFWGNQHGSQDIITIQQSTNTNDTPMIQTKVGRLRLGGSHERSFYYYKDDSRFRLYLYVYVRGGNSYGRWNISYLGGNATWVTDHQQNVTKSSSWIGIGYSAQVNYASSSGSASKVYGQVGDTGSHELVRCDMSNDQFRIIAGSSGNNKGWAEIAIADDGNEPIYVRQYSGVFSSVVRTLTLLDANGHTHFPSYINIGGNENNNSSPDRVWGSNGSDSYLRSYRTSALNVASATKLQTPRTIWGQSFDGTGNVSGTFTSGDINIGATNEIWSPNYDLHIQHTNRGNKNVYICCGAATGKVGIGTDSPSYKLHVAGNIYASDTIISESNKIGLTIRGPLNAAWSSWFAHETSGNEALVIATQNQATTIMLTNGESYSNISADRYTSMTPALAIEHNQVMINRPYSSSGCGYNFYVNGTSNFNGKVDINNILTARGIMFTTANVNAYGTSLQNWDGSIGANVTNMFNGISYDNITIEYSQDNGASWHIYTTDPAIRFNLVNDNVNIFNYYLGNNATNGNNDAEKLTQIKKNQLRVTIKIPNEIYQELSWISVDVNNGVDVKCQVYFGTSGGAYTEYVSKVMIGWSHKCDICVGPANVNVGNNDCRYVRLVFSHPSNNSQLRNCIVCKIRALALTKYSHNTDRYTISTTGHIYDYDYNMNTYFPNSILAKGGVTAYQSSDVRLKTNITKLNCLKVIKSIGGTYEFDYIREHKHSIGFIAQNVNNPLLNDIVAKDDNGYLKINYWNPKLISLAFGALTEIDDEVDKLKARVRELESEVEYLKNKAYALQ